MAITFGSDPVREELARLVADLQAGTRIDASYETKRVDLKEEAGRRGSAGDNTPGTPRNEAAAHKLAAAAACMSNTPGGGALLVGIADDGTLIGAKLEAEWLRHRIYEHSQRLLTVDISEVVVAGTRLLAIVSPHAVEPIRINGRIKWRVDDHCVEVDAATWHAQRMLRLNYDWSADDSHVPLSQVRPQALDIAREFLRHSGDTSAEDLARATDNQLLRRLNVVTDEGNLTNAGALAFVGRGRPCLDYMHREYSGSDSTHRVHQNDRSLLEETSEVVAAIHARNITTHIHTGFVVGQVRQLPELAAREAIVNGLAHREWGTPAPTVVEHVGATLRVTSPGSFFGGVNESNIITHPSQSRNASLAQLLADLRVAEREGIGVDRMVREMIRVGHQPPVIHEISGPYVRTSLVGHALDEPWIGWLSAITPQEEARDVSSLLLLNHLISHGWVDEEVAAPLIQLPAVEARGALIKLSGAEIAGHPLILVVEGTPEGTPTAWHLGQHALKNLLSRDRAEGRVRQVPSRTELAKSYARARGRVSTTELGSLANASPTNVGGTLKGLVEEGLLSPSSTSGRGRGFYYKWVPNL